MSWRRLPASKPRASAPSAKRSTPSSDRFAVEQEDLQPVLIRFEINAVGGASAARFAGEGGADIVHAVKLKRGDEIALLGPSERRNRANAGFVAAQARQGLRQR